MTKAAPTAWTKLSDSAFDHVSTGHYTPLAAWSFDLVTWAPNHENSMWHDVESWKGEYYLMKGISLATYTMHFILILICCFPPDTFTETGIFCSCCFATSSYLIFIKRIAIWALWTCGCIATRHEFLLPRTDTSKKLSVVQKFRPEDKSM